MAWELADFAAKCIGVSWLCGSFASKTSWIKDSSRVRNVGSFYVIDY